MPSAKLILVEDDPALAELLEFRFANEGYQVRVTADGDEALLMASEEGGVRGGAAASGSSSPLSLSIAALLLSVLYIVLCCWQMDGLGSVILAQV